MSDKPPESGVADIGPGVHIRDIETVGPAGQALYRQMQDWRKQWPLTANEVLFVLSRVQMEFVTYMVNEERTPK